MLCDFKVKITNNHSGDIWEGSDKHIKGVHHRAQRQIHTQIVSWQNYQLFLQK